MELMNLSCEGFLEELASKAAAPGGGGASALVGAAGVALGSMVGSLTVGKKKYAAVEADIQALNARAEALRGELEALHAVCKARHLPLFIDGARLGAALYSPVCDYTLADMAHMCEVFTIGGTKMGLLFGEAAVFSAPELAKDFRYFIKQNGGMLAKGRLLGEQFLALLDGEDGSGSSLYFTMAKKADEQALRIRAAFEAKGCKVLHDSPTNQQFFVLPDEWYDKLAETYAMTHMGKPDKHHTAVRICTSWATKDETVEQLIEDVNAL